ncbi:hypothetical protein NL108_016983, partial [Boleophthalmus pectinirostris]
YGLPLLPHFPPAPYMEASPGFVLPHTHHHLMDYRRLLNPQYYQSMAYHARRLRYQQNLPTRDVTSSEVQTEPLPVSQRTSTSTPSLNQTDAQKESSNLSTASSAQKDDRTLALNDLAPLTANATPQKGSFVIETEEVRIECCASPAGLQVLHSHETSEMSRRFAQDVVHCSSIVQNGVRPDDNAQIVNTEIKNVRSPQPCPDILLVANPNTNDKNIEVETAVTNNSKLKISADVEAIRNEKNLKVVRLPFNPRYLAELRKIESSVWSAEETLTPSSEFIMDSCNETFLSEAEKRITRDKTGQDDVVPFVYLPKTMNEELENAIPTFENSIVDLPDKEIQKQSCVYSKIDLKCSQNLLSDDSPLDGNLQEQPDTSFESLPAYLPSTNWLADFENTIYAKMPPTPQKANKQMESRSLIVPGRRRKLDAEFKDVTAIRKPKERYKSKGNADRGSVSDHECCVSRSYNENAFVSYATKGQRLCTRCMSKQKIYKTSTSPAQQQVSQRRVTPFQPWNDDVLTCDACKGHTTKQFARKGSIPEIRVDRDGEVSQNGCKWRSEETRKETKRPLALKPQNVEKCYWKTRERGCAYGEPQHDQWRRVYHCCHGNAIREADEN